ncbi:MAG: hypothetical protein AABX51_08015, partial [Nanoarchaeota archaeon]
MSPKNQDKVPLNWQKAGEWLAEQALKTANISNFTYEGTNIYTSHNPKSLNDSFYKWINSWLNKQPGIQVYCLDRKIKNPPKCPSCHRTIDNCPFCI